MVPSLGQADNGAWAGAPEQLQGQKPILCFYLSFGQKSREVLGRADSQQVALCRGKPGIASGEP